MHDPDRAIPTISDGWTDGRVEQLKNLWADGLSATQIAMAIGGGLSRNAVIGKIHRLKLQSRRAPQPRTARRSSHKPFLAPGKASARKVVTGGAYAGTVGKSRRERIETRSAAAVAPGPSISLRADSAAFDALALMIPLVKLTESTCKWPIGDPAEPTFGFCGHPSPEGSPYCDHHHARSVGRVGDYATTPNARQAA